MRKQGRSRYWDWDGRRMRRPYTEPLNAALLMFYRYTLPAKTGRRNPLRPHYHWLTRLSRINIKPQTQRLGIEGVANGSATIHRCAGR